MSHQTSGDADSRWQLGKVSAPEPLGVDDFFSVGDRLSRFPRDQERRHQGVGEGPGLAGQVDGGADLQTDFFGHFPRHGFFQGLTRLDKPRHAGIDRCAGSGVFDQQDLVTAVDQHDHCRSDPGPKLGSAGRTVEGKLFVASLGGRTAGPAEPVGRLPRRQLGGSDRRLDLIAVDFGEELAKRRPDFICGDRSLDGPERNGFAWEGILNLSEEQSGRASHGQGGAARPTPLRRRTKQSRFAERGMDDAKIVGVGKNQSAEETDHA